MYLGSLLGANMTDDLGLVYDGMVGNPLTCYTLLTVLVSTEY